jgi:butyrate kinase
MSALVLAVAPTANATRMALFRGFEPLRAHTETHSELELQSRRVDQRGLRARIVRTFLETAGVQRGGLAAVVGHGGVLRPVEGGTYEVSPALLRDAERAAAEHPANVGASVVHAIAAEWGCPAFVVDPDSVDERETIARLAQPCDVVALQAPALAMRAAARRHARAVNRPFEALRVVVAHLGASVSLCAQRAGRMVDVVDLWERPAACGRLCGAVPETALADLGDREPRPAPRGAPDLVEALARAERGDTRAAIVLQTAGYRIAKAVGELATVLEGEVDAVLLTGGLAGAGPIVADVCRRVEWIAPVFLYRDQSELLALAEGALRVLTGEEPAKRYA